MKPQGPKDSLSSPSLDPAAQVLNRPAASCPWAFALAGCDAWGCHSVLLPPCCLFSRGPARLYPRVLSPLLLLASPQSPGHLAISCLWPSPERESQPHSGSAPSICCSVLVPGTQQVSANSWTNMMFRVPRLVDLPQPLVPGLSKACLSSHTCAWPAIMHHAAKGMSPTCFKVHFLWQTQGIHGACHTFATPRVPVCHKQKRPRRSLGLHSPHVCKPVSMYVCTQAAWSCMWALWMRVCFQEMPRAVLSLRPWARSIVLAGPQFPCLRVTVCPGLSSRGGSVPGPVPTTGLGWG